MQHACLNFNSQGEPEDIRYVDGMMMLIGQASIERKAKIESFEEIGWHDPEIEYKLATQRTLTWLKNLHFADFVYPNMSADDTIVPKCIFLPS